MNQAASLLADARIKHRRLAELPADVRPKNEDEAYRAQEDVVGAWLAHYGGETIGYKIACTNVTAQRQLNVTGPFYGRLLSPFLRESPGIYRASDFFMRVVEAEFGFRMACELPRGDYSHDQIADAVEGVIPGIEIVDSRFDDWTTIGAVSLTTDNACNAAWVRGKLLKDWRGIDLAAQTVRVSVNGKFLREGTGAAVLGHPLNAMQWLASRVTLKAGEHVTTGVTMEVYMGESGDKIHADFGPVGIAEVEFE